MLIPIAIYSSIIAPQAAIPFSFTKDSYEQKLSIYEKNISLKELMQRIGQACEENIEVSKELSSCRLKLKLKDRKISEILQNIETVYDGEYKRQAGKLHFALKKARTEESRNWWKTYNKERELAIQQLAALRRKAFDNVPKERQPDKALTEVTFWKKLPNELKDNVSNDIDQRCLYKLDVTTLYHKRFMNSLLIEKNHLSNDLLEEISSSVKAYQSGSSLTDFSFDSVSFNWSLTNAHIAIAQGNRDIVTGLQISFTPNNLDDKELVNKIYSVIQLNHRPLKKVFEKDSKVSKNIKELIKASDSKFWSEETLPAEEPGKDLEIYSRNNIMDCLSENPDFEFISDLYYQPETLLPKVEKQKIVTDKPDDILKKYSIGWDVSVKKSSNITLVRNNKWYRDDYLMPDIKACEALLDLYNKLSPLPPDKATNLDYELLRTFGQVTNSQSLFQISNGLSYYSPDKNVDSVFFKGDYAYPLSQITDFMLYQYELISFVNELNEGMFKALTSTGIEYKNLSGPMQEKLLKIPSVRLRPPTSLNDVIKLKTVNSSLMFDMKSKNAGIIPRLLALSYTFEVLKHQPV